MKIRWTALMLAVLMMLATGCGGNNASDSQNDRDDNDSENNEVVTTQPEETQNELTIGKIENNIYTSKYLGFGFRLDSDWTYRDASELQDLKDYYADAVEGTILGDALKENEQLYDLVAENAADLFSVNIIYTKLSDELVELYQSLTKEELVDAVFQEFNIVVESLEATGVEVKNIEKVTVNFLGEERPAILFSASLTGVEYYCLQLYFYDIGEYGAVVSLCSYTENRTEELLDLFYKLD